MACTVRLVHQTRLHNSQSGWCYGAKMILAQPDKTMVPLCSAQVESSEVQKEVLAAINGKVLTASCLKSSQDVLGLTLHNEMWTDGCPFVDVQRQEAILVDLEKLVGDRPLQQANPRIPTKERVAEKWTGTPY